MNNLNADKLIRAGRAVPEPFSLTIEFDGGAPQQMNVEKILRLLPGRRIVAVARVGGRRLLVKLFIGRMARRYLKREIRGVQAITRAGVSTPALVSQGQLHGGGGYLAAFEYLEDAHSLMSEWNRAQHYDDRLSLMRRVLPILASLHQAGVVQQDIHPENFLISQGKIYTIDGGGVGRVAKAALSEQRSIDNLALFCAQFHPVNDDLLPELLHQYRASRGWQASEGSDLGPLISRRRAERKAEYIGKAFRECTRFACRRSFTRFSVCERALDTPEIRRLLADPDAAMTGGEVLKQGHTATVVRVDTAEGPLVIKRYNIKSWTHLLSRLFRKSRGWHSWANAMRLEFLGIPVVQPVALIEERVGPLRRRAYFITRFVPGTDATNLASFADPTPAISSLARIITSLAEAGVSHGDLKASNFLVNNDEVIILDLDGMTEYADPRAGAAAADRDLNRFMQNWSDAPAIRQKFSDLLG